MSVRTVQAPELSPEDRAAIAIALTERVLDQTVRLRGVEPRNVSDDWAPLAANTVRLADIVIDLMELYCLPDGSDQVALTPEEAKSIRIGLDQFDTWRRKEYVRVIDRRPRLVLTFRHQSYLLADLMWAKE